MTEERLTALLAERVMGWKVSPDRFLTGGRQWLQRWRFQPTMRMQDAFLLLERAAPQEYTMGAIRSTNALARSLRELESIYWLTRPPAAGPPGIPLRATGTYTLTPHSDELVDLANANVAAFRKDIEDEKELRKEERRKRDSLLSKTSEAQSLRGAK